MPAGSHTPVADPVAPLRFYVYDSGTGILHRSTDGGTSFSAAASGLPTGANPPVPALGREGDLWLAVVNFFAAFPWGPASAAAAEIVPPSIRTQGAALYFFLLSLISGTLGPTAVAFLTDHVFGDPLAVRYSLVVVNVIGMLATIVLLIAGMPAYRRSVRAAEESR